MIKQVEMTQEALNEVTAEAVGVVELSDEMLQMVAGGRIIEPGNTVFVDSCIPRGSHLNCP